MTGRPPARDRLPVRHRQLDARQCAALGRGAQALADPARPAGQDRRRDAQVDRVRRAAGEGHGKGVQGRRLLVADRRAFRHVAADRLRDRQARQEKTRPQVSILPSIAATYPPSSGREALAPPSS